MERVATWTCFDGSTARATFTQASECCPSCGRRGMWAEGADGPHVLCTDCGTLQHRCGNSGPALEVISGGFWKDVLKQLRREAA
jgi:hypothetical protein